MTGGGFARVDPDRMVRSAAVFEEAERAVRVAAEMRHDVARHEGTQVWGSDETGQGFEQGYRQKSNGIFDSLDGVAELMGNLAKGTVHTAEQYRRTEQGNRQTVEALARSGDTAGRKSKRAEPPGPSERREHVVDRVVRRDQEPEADVVAHRGVRDGVEHRSAADVVEHRSERQVSPRDPGAPTERPVGGEQPRR